ncbi:hypothetical protein SLA2020_447660 [Shorea laevis]
MLEAPPEPTFLAASIIKAKYYPHSTIWRPDWALDLLLLGEAYFSGSDLLKDGLIWRVGDGKDIRVWQDRWLPTPISFSIQSPRRILSEDARVAELIDQDTKWWNTNLLREVFMRRKHKSSNRFH